MPCQSPWDGCRGIPDFRGRRGQPPLGAARLSSRYGVIAMGPGSAPTLIALPAVLVAVRIGVTVPVPP